MIATFPALSPDALALCADIDGGDDSALPILADELEICSDPRAAGLRELIGKPFLPGGALPRPGPSWAYPGEWYWEQGYAHFGGPRLPGGVWLRLEGGRRPEKYNTSVYYPAPAAAYLDLAQALIGGD